MCKIYKLKKKKKSNYIHVVRKWICNNWCNFFNLKAKFSSGIEGALASTLNRDFNWKQLSENYSLYFFNVFKV